MGRRVNVRKGPVFDMDGILLVDKPADWTSFDVVNCVRSRFNIPKVGHCGTLDPAATGLLVVVLGEYTKFSDKLMAADKVYECTLRLGIETDSYDLEGQVVAEKEVNVSEEQLLETLKSFEGDQMQMPPMVSAVKVGGKKLYELARKGVEIQREARPIHISAIKVSRVALPDCDFVLECSKGTYVRSLCHDAGEKLGCGGTLAALRRLRSGNFDIKDAVTVDFLMELDVEGFKALLAEKLSTFAGFGGR
jgi:tRNA pseudouridine55 synthase